jgi:predicted nucleotidyltransferase
MTRESVIASLKKHKALFQKAYIFGSMARGESDEYSDTDIVFVRDTKRDFFHRIIDIMDIILDLQNVDALIYTAAEFEKMRQNNGFIQSIIEESIQVEGKQSRS